MALLKNRTPGLLDFVSFWTFDSDYAENLESMQGEMDTMDMVVIGTGETEVHLESGEMERMNVFGRTGGIRRAGGKFGEQDGIWRRASGNDHLITSPATFLSMISHKPLLYSVHGNWKSNLAQVTQAFQSHTGTFETLINTTRKWQSYTLSLIHI